MKILIKQPLVSCNYNLKPCNISYFCANSSSVNYGKNNSVYEHFKSKTVNIMQGNCHAIHNMGKSSCKLLKYDVEVLILKAFNEFSSTAKILHKLNCFFKNLEQKYSMHQHACYLFHAVDHLLKNWKPIHSYFLSQERKTNPLILYFHIKARRIVMMTMMLC
jgi:hypothetical protein